VLLIDTSGSMSGDKIDQAKQAALAFIDKLPTQNRLGLTTFNENITERVALDSFERNSADVRAAIQSLRAGGDTSLYDAIIQAVGTLSQGQESDRIRAIVLLSDGQDTASTQSLNTMVTAINAQRGGKNPILIIPVAYGSDADINALNAIARASSSRVQSGDPASIQKVLEIISSYF
jgi:Ca-activated chloride channel family protein